MLGLVSISTSTSKFISTYAPLLASYRLPTFQSIPADPSTASLHSFAFLFPIPIARPSSLSDDHNYSTVRTPSVICEQQNPQLLQHYTIIHTLPHHKSHCKTLKMATEVEQPVALAASGPPHASMSPSIAPGSASSQTSGSPTNKQNSSPTANSSSQAASRRPPRKSTLTQQQKNQKRQRATQDQLATLEIEFNKNPTPTATVRDRIADEINMTERSVQIWFQNRCERKRDLVVNRSN